jgi:hypothetical protein
MRLLYWNDILIDLSGSNEFGYNVQNFDFNNIIERRINYVSNIKAVKNELNRITFGFADNVKSKTTVPYLTGLVRAVYNGVELFNDYIGEVVDVEKYYSVNIYAPDDGFFNTIKQGNISLNSSIEDWNNTEISSARDNLTENLKAPVIDYGRLSPKDFFFENPTILSFNISEIPGWTRVEHPSGVNIFVPNNSFTWGANTELESYYLRSNRVEAIIISGYDYDINLEFDINSITATTLTVNIFFASISGDRVLAASQTYTTTGSKTLTNTFTAPGDFEFVEIQMSRDTTVNVTGDFTVIEVTADFDGTLNVRMPYYVLGLSYRNIINQIISNAGYTNVIDWDIIDDIVYDAWLNGPVTGTLSTTEGEDYSHRLMVTIAPEFIEGTSPNWGSYIEEITNYNCFKDFIIRFCLIVFVKNNSVYARPFEYIINDRANSLDWTAKRDTSKDDKIVFKNSQYAQSNLFIDPAYSEETERYEATLSIANDNLDKIKTLYESCFSSPSIQSRGVDFWDDVPTIPLFKKDSTNSRTIEDAKSCLIWTRDEAAADETVQYAGSTETSYKVARYFYANEPNDLHVGSSWTFFLRVFYKSITTLLQKYKVITRYYVLTENDLNDYNPFRIIFDDGAYYYIVRIHNFVPGEKTKVELFKVS